MDIKHLVIHRASCLEPRGWQYPVLRITTLEDMCQPPQPANLAIHRGHGSAGRRQTCRRTAFLAARCTEEVGLDTDRLAGVTRAGRHACCGRERRTYGKSRCTVCHGAGATRFEHASDSADRTLQAAEAASPPPPLLLQTLSRVALQPWRQSAPSREVRTSRRDGRARWLWQAPVVKAKSCCVILSSVGHSWASGASDRPQVEPPVLRISRKAAAQEKHKMAGFAEESRTTLVGQCHDHPAA